MVKDSYVKPCDVMPGSLLAWRASAVDASIADVPADAVNWEDADRVSSAVPLGDGRAVILVRHFVNDPDDPLEGKRERVLLARASERALLENDCPSAGAFTARAGRVAFQCAREVAGDVPLHGVLAFSAQGKKLTELAHCRSPAWTHPGVLVCDEELVDARGELTLRPRRTRLP